jgi:maleylacetate reductase
MKSFVHDMRTARIIFGSGTSVQLGDELARIGARRAFLLSTPEQAHQAQGVASLGELLAGHFATATMHTPVEVTERALQKVLAAKADCLIAVGGGSTTGLGKALALRTGLPQIVVPTTYAGSEVTSLLGQTEDGVKTTLRDPAILPGTVIYDVDLTLTLPVAASITSALNAAAHAVEALYAPDRTPLTDAMAEAGLKAIGRSLKAVAADPLDRVARSDLLCGAWLCGTVLGATTMGLHHKLCHTLGGTLDLPHAETHSLILPHAIAYNEPGARKAIRAAGDALRLRSVARELHILASSLGVSMALSSFGVTDADLDQIADLAVRAPYPNPMPIERAAIRKLLGDALAGTPPQEPTLSAAEMERYGY